METSTFHSDSISYLTPHKHDIGKDSKQTQERKSNDGLISPTSVQIHFTSVIENKLNPPQTFSYHDGNIFVPDPYSSTHILLRQSQKIDKNMSSTCDDLNMPRERSSDDFESIESEDPMPFVLNDEEYKINDICVERINFEESSETVIINALKQTIFPNREKFQANNSRRSSFNMYVDSLKEFDSTNRDQFESEVCNFDLIDPSHEETNSTLNQRSICFSKLMEKAAVRSEPEEVYLYDASFHEIPQSHSDEMLASNNESEKKVQINTSATSNLFLEEVSRNYFRISISAPNTISIGHALDVVSNPNLLRHWCESINMLIDIDKKGRSSPPSIHRDYDDEYVEPLLGEYCRDMNMIIPSRANNDSSKIVQREYDGEWVHVLTSSIVSPYAHSNILASCVRKTREMVGFPSYGSLSMFIEHKLHQVSFSIGPFNGGIMLTHKIALREDEINGRIVITDEVNVMEREDNKCVGFRAPLYCCLAPLHSLLNECLLPRMDGFIEQTQQSLLNLVKLMERSIKNPHYHNGYQTKLS